jgi:CRP/FNR family transcriptional regulator, polysaccharide utilization system transcription regulator
MVPRAKIACRFCDARHRGLLCPRRAETAERFSRDLVSHEVRRGQSLFHAGEPAHSVHVIRSGRVRVYTRWHDGDEQVLRLLGPGEILGYRPVLAGELYNASADAVVDSTVCILPAESVRKMLREDPDLAMLMLEKLARDLRISEDLMMELVHRPVGQRVARLLLSLIADGACAGPGLSISAREMTRRDMARTVGTTPETISRVLRRLSQRSVLSVTRDCVRVRDLDLLHRAAGERRPAT